MKRGKTKTDLDQLSATRFTSVARLLFGAFNVCRDQVIEKLASRGHPDITMSHGVVLRQLDLEGTPLALVTRRADVSRQAVAKVAGQLEKLGYLRTVPDPNDRRAKLLKFTPKGLRLFADSIEVYGAFEEELAERIGRRRLEAFRETLQMIAPEHGREL